MTGRAPLALSGSVDDAPPPAPASGDAGHPLFRLVDLMAALRDPRDGRPWERAQTFASIAPYTIEEAYEVADAIERGAMADLRDELGDLLLQVVFHARIAEEAGAFEFRDVAEAIVEKIIRRRPNAAADDGALSAAEQSRAWQSHKAAERAARAPAGASRLDGVAVALPALTRATELSSRAAAVGFVWPTIEDVIEKLREEIAELEVEIAKGDTEAACAELGDILFVCANIARELGADPEQTLRGSNAKFVRRFSFVERGLADLSLTPESSDLPQMEALWQAAKRAERGEG